LVRREFSPRPTHLARVQGSAEAFAMQTCPDSASDGKDASFEVDVAEMSGRVHRIGGLSADVQFKTLLVKVANALDHTDCGLGLVLGDKLLTDDHRYQTMCELGVTAGKVLTAVKMKGNPIYEFSGFVGDEDVHPHATNDTIVQVCFLGHTCVLVRRTSRRIWLAGSDSFIGSCTYDICRGFYRMTEVGVAICSWQQQFRRVRSGTTRTSTFSVNDSGWIRRRDAVPERLRNLEIHDSNKWTKWHGRVIDGECVLGVRMSGKGGAAEVVQTLALA